MSPRTGKPPARGEITVAGRPATWVRDGDVDGRPLVLLGHGAGAPLRSPFMEEVAAGLVLREVTVVRFNFPYMERLVRESRRSAPDRPPVLLSTIRGMLSVIAAWPVEPRPPLVLGGKSMGGRMMSMLLAEETPANVRGAVYLGYPLSPAGQPQKTRAEHLAAIAVPQLFVSGSRDSLCDLSRLRAVLTPLGARARLHVVEGGDHSLSTSRKDPFQKSDVWLAAVAQFVHDVARA